MLLFAFFFFLERNALDLSGGGPADAAAVTPFEEDGEPSHDDGDYAADDVANHQTIRVLEHEDEGEDGDEDHEHSDADGKGKGDTPV